MKVNVVVKRGLNEASILDIARRFRGTGHTVGSSSSWTSARRTAGASTTSFRPPEIVSTIGAEFPLEPVEAAYRGEVAERYRYLDGAGEIGVIASVTQPFCGDCTARASRRRQALHLPLRRPRPRPPRAAPLGSSDELEETIRAVWTRRADRYSEIRTAETSALRKVEMSYIGG